MRFTVTASLLALVAIQTTAKPLFGGLISPAYHRSVDDDMCSRCFIARVFGRKSYQLDDAQVFCSSYIAPVVTTTVVAAPTQYNPRQKEQLKVGVPVSLPTPSPASHLAAQVISSACSCIVKTPLPTQTLTETIQPPQQRPTDVPDVYTPIESLDELKKRGPADFAPFGSGAIAVAVEERGFGLGETRDWYKEH